MMNTYVALTHTHRLVVTLFLLLYIIKAALLILNRKEALEKVTKVTRIPEMVISTLFLVTGVWLLFEIAEINVMHIVKIGMVLASIPVAVIGFRKGNKILAALSVLLLLGVYGIAEANKIGVNDEPIAANIITETQAEGYDQLTHGEALYTRNCVVCHGPEGNLQLSGAKNLQVSQLSDEEMKTLIVNGKNGMPAYGKLYKEEETSAVIAYVKVLRK